LALRTPGLAQPAAHGPHPLGELRQDLPRRQFVLVEQAHQPASLVGVLGHRVEGESAQQADQGGGQPQAQRRAQFRPAGVQDAALGQEVEVGVQETDGGQAQGDRRGVGEHDVQGAVRGRQFLLRVHRREAAAAAEVAGAVRAGVARDELFQGADQDARCLGVAAEGDQGVAGVRGDVVGVFEPQFHQAGGRQQEAEQLLGVDDGVAAVRVSPGPFSPAHRVRGRCRPDLQEAAAGLDVLTAHDGSHSYRTAHCWLCLACGPHRARPVAMIIPV
jgi:hypothetical protein